MRTSPSRNFFANTDQLWAHKQIFHNNTTDTGRTGPFVNFPPPPDEPGRPGLPPPPSLPFSDEPGRPNVPGL